MVYFKNTALILIRKTSSSEHLVSDDYELDLLLTDTLLFIVHNLKYVVVDNRVIGAFFESEW